MKRIFTYIMTGLAIVVGFCLAFTIILVLIAKDNEGTHELSDRWMPYMSIILVIAIPALLVWVIFRLLRNFFFRKIRKSDFEHDRISDNEDRLS